MSGFNRKLASPYNGYSSLYEATYTASRVRAIMRKSFSSGVASIAAIPEGYYHPHQIPVIFDNYALQTDWKVIGYDLSTSIAKLRNANSLK